MNGRAKFCFIRNGHVKLASSPVSCRIVLDAFSQIGTPIGAKFEGRRPALFMKIAPRPAKADKIATVLLGRVHGHSPLRSQAPTVNRFRQGKIAIILSAPAGLGAIFKILLSHLPAKNDHSHF